MRIKADDVIVDGPDKATRRFRLALSKIAKVPKMITRAKHRHTTVRPKKAPKG